jgi:hypothetical protein
VRAIIILLARVFALLVWGPAGDWWEACLGLGGTGCRRVMRGCADGDFKLTESLVVLDYLETAYPDAGLSLLPSDPVQRANVTLPLLPPPFLYINVFICIYLYLHALICIYMYLFVLSVLKCIFCPCMYTLQSAPICALRDREALKHGRLYLVDIPT